MNPTLHPVSSDLLSILQHLALNTSLLPSIKGFTCYETTAALIPFISLFLSRTTTAINLDFARTLSGPSPLMIASMIGTLPRICPNLQRISLSDLPNDPIITTIVSEIPLILGDALQRFDVDSPLTSAACNVLCALPNLSDLRTVFEGQTRLPQMALPALAKLKVKYSSGYGWLRAFSGAELTKLKVVSFHDTSPQGGNFLGAFKSIAITTTIPTTLSTFRFHSSHPWNPDYPSLFVFKQLKVVTVGNPCRNGCSSTVNDAVVTDLARALPKLQVLKLGSDPCGATVPTGVTTKGLVELACHCVDLITLRVHIRVNSLVQAAVGETGTPPPENDPAARKECSLTTLEVGKMLVPDGSALTVALALFHMFPRIQDIHYINPQWASVEDTIRISRRLSNRIGILANSSSTRSSNTSRLTTDALVGDIPSVG